MNADDSERLDRLEQEVAMLRAELERLSEVKATRAKPAEPERPARIGSIETKVPPRPLEPPTLRAEPDPHHTLEEIVGRYGTIAVATLTVLIGIGIFLNWAIEHAILGPGMRVVLGYTIALAVAAVGARLRIRGTRDFGNVLLALALAIVHLVSWSAGPLLHVIPSPAALAIGFVASAVLSEFALRHDEENLVALGFGGAMIAPFVLSDPGGNAIALAGYGLIVTALAAAALGDRDWRIARRVTVLSLFVYTVVVGLGLPADSPPAWISARLWLIFPLAALLAVLPVSRPPQRRVLLRTATLGFIFGGLLLAIGGPDPWALGLSILGSIIAIAVLDLTRPAVVEGEGNSASDDESLGVEGGVFDAFVLPLFLFVSTVMSTQHLNSYPSAAVALLWTIGALWMSHRNRAEPEGGYYASVSALIALWIVPAAWLNHELALVSGSAAMGLLLIVIAGRMNRLPFLVGGLTSLAMASLWSLMTIMVSGTFYHVPFTTIHTIGCLVAVAGWLAAVVLTRSPAFLPSLGEHSRELLRRGLITAASVTAFVWGVGELQRAWNVETATSLLILYYAATGTFMIWLGRVRAVKTLRLIGLGVSLWAAWKTLQEAFFIPNVAVRIGLFFAVSAFLIAVGYWYRRSATEEV